MLDGQHGSFYQNASNLNAGTVPTARLGTGTTTSNLSTISTQINTLPQQIAGTV